MIKAIIFDFDGVIIDSKEASNRMIKQVCGENGFEISEDQINPLHGLTLEEVYKKLLPKSFLTKEKLDEMYARSHEVYYDIISLVRIINDADRVIPNLKEKYKLAIVTNRGPSTYRILKTLSMEDLFDVIVTEDECTNHKPHPEPIQKALSKLGVSSSETILIGDKEVDRETGKNANMKTLIVNEDIISLEDLERFL